LAIKGPTPAKAQAANVLNVSGLTILNSLFFW